MKRLSILILVVGLTAFACKKSEPAGGDDNNGNPIQPNPGSTTETKTFSIPLKGANEIPPISGSEANATGTANITIHATKNASGTITSATADFQVTLSGLAGNSSITMAHIHSGNNTVPSGGIVVNTGIASGDAPVNNGSSSFTRNGINLSASDAQSILGGPGNFYFNVHSGANGGGVARGQVDGSGAPSDPDPNPNDPNKPDPDPYPYGTSAHKH